VLSFQTRYPSYLELRIDNNVTASTQPTRDVNFSAQFRYSTTITVSSHICKCQRMKVANNEFKLTLGCASRFLNGQLLPTPHHIMIVEVVSASGILLKQFRICASSD
jgi:hypothetical protein